RRRAWPRRRRSSRRRGGRQAIGSRSTWAFASPYEGCDAGGVAGCTAAAGWRGGGAGVGAGGGVAVGWRGGWRGRGRGGAGGGEGHEDGDADEDQVSLVLGGEDLLDLVVALGHAVLEVFEDPRGGLGVVGDGLHGGAEAGEVVGDDLVVFVEDVHAFAHGVED